ncbi:MAG: hypothetical protein LBB21_01090 [Holosporaceae bacterium]|jgi:TldD protein|nr:hypothetical protein [Holosporaceae bacterium]
MTSIGASEFFGDICDLPAIEKVAVGAFCDGNKGELFVEYKEEETLRIENGIVQAPSFAFKRGFGLRSFKEAVSFYSHSHLLNEKSVKKALEVIKSGNASCCVKINESVNTHDLYCKKYFMDSVTLENKIKLLQKIDAYARSKSENVRQVTALLSGSWQVISILTDEGRKVYDIRPMVRLSVQIVVEKNGVLESGMYSGGGRFGYGELLGERTKEDYVNEALRQAEIKLQAIKAPVGEMPVVLGNGWTGILLHEAVGHGLEGDAIRKKTSSFHNLLGKMIAAPRVTVVDDGTLSNRRGSINVDDEGTDSHRTVLIENGKLVGLMQDRMNADLMGVNVTGNGRRESYKVMPIPRMTNTFMVAGDYSREEMIASVKNGIFAKSFSDGQVDVASGKFVFSASEAYVIENGRIAAPVKGAMLIGDGPSILKRISMIGNDFSLDNGVGTCGKDGQWVPVGVGEPSVLIDKITVGGANL